MVALCYSSRINQLPAICDGFMMSHILRCGADFSAMGENRWSAHTPTNIAKELGIPLAKATAWAAGHTQMMRDTQAALGNGLLMGKDAPELGDHVHGVLEEGGCYKRNSTVNTLRNLTARARAAGAAGKAWVYQCHSSDATTDTLAAFLAGAGDGHFLTVGSGGVCFVSFFLSFSFSSRIYII